MERTNEQVEFAKITANEIAYALRNAGFKAEHNGTRTIAWLSHRPITAMEITTALANADNDWGMYTIAPNQIKTRDGVVEIEFDETKYAN